MLTGVIRGCAGGGEEDDCDDNCYQGLNTSNEPGTMLNVSHT